MTARTRERRALLVVDMLSGFLDPKGSLYCGASARKIIPFIRRRIREYARRKEPVIFVCDNHIPNDPEFKQFGRHCVRGTWEAEIIPELPVPSRAAIVPKRRLNVFYKSGLGRVLNRLRPATIEVVGVCTNICVFYAVADLRTRGYRVIVPRKGVATFDHKAHGFALRQMQSVFGAEVV